MIEIIDWLNVHPNLASWVQAAGVIISLAGAIGIATYQNHAQRKLAIKQKNQDTYNRIAAIIGLNEYALDFIEDAENFWANCEEKHEDFFQYYYDAGAMERINNSLTEIPIYEMPDETTIKETMTIALSFHKLRKVLEKVSAQPLIRNDSDVSSFQSLAGAVGHSNDKLKAHLDSLKKK